jgi:very-short-patch-repair endonuclease
MPRTLLDLLLRDAARRLRRDPTEAEHKLWRAIRGSALGVGFRRQHPIGSAIADFACVEGRLVVELDGGQHGGAADGERDAAMQAAGWRVLRYWNNEVIENLEGVLADILKALAERRDVLDAAPPPRPSPASGGGG